ncbi:hypothetical protein TrRE_jg2223 [Triparma retinervis]|uniref:Uncharacterized protein n=1 Tax=Triparma retinervis TaxID=2557542 RepID=A0A9W6ZMM4_9STRA|nr:hypothetical protein TrRE_jg2223 [Triparma retinervis]
MRWEHDLVQLFEVQGLSGPPAGGGDEGDWGGREGKQEDDDGVEEAGGDNKPNARDSMGEDEGEGDQFV